MDKTPRHPAPDAAPDARPPAMQPPAGTPAGLPPGLPPGFPHALPPGAGGPPVITIGPPPKRSLGERWRAFRHGFEVALAGAPLAPNEIPGLEPFERAAPEIMSRATTREAQRLARVSVAVIVVLVVWAAFARVDEVTRGDGHVVPSKQLQVLQALDGGVVAQILVQEGQVVEAGQLLLKIDDTRASSGVAENQAQGIALGARVARLKALSQGTPFEPPAASTEDERRIVAEEKRLYDSKMLELGSQLGITRQQLAQRQQELAETEAKRTAAQRALDLSQKELDQTRPLLATGAVSEIDIVHLERDVTKNRGDVEQAKAQIQRVNAAISEAEHKIRDTELSFRNEAGRDLAESMGKLNVVNEGNAALADKVDKASVRSPVRGRVQRLLANTVGGVVQPGKDIVEIVPSDDTLVLEARVLPRDIAFILPGQTANVKFTAYDFSVYGGLEAKVENISPDTVVDEKGNAYYVVRVRTLKSRFGEKLPILPGMTAEVDILTGQKSVLSYLLKPVLKVKAYALRER